MKQILDKQTTKKEKGIGKQRTGESTPQARKYNTK